MSNAELVDTIAHILEPWAFETKSYNATIARDDATAKATQIVEALAALDSRAGDAGEGFGTVLERWDSVIPLSHDERAKLIAELTAATPAPAADAVPAGEGETFGGVPIAAIKAQMQAVEDEAARTLWIGAPLLKGLTGYIRAALSHGEGRK